MRTSETIYVRASTAHLQFVLMLFVDLSQQLCFAAVQGLDEGVALRHQTGLELHTVLLQGSKGRVKNK